MGAVRRDKTAAVELSCAARRPETACFTPAGGQRGGTARAGEAGEAPRSVRAAGRPAGGSSLPGQGLPGHGPDSAHCAGHHVTLWGETGAPPVTGSTLTTDKAVA